jgi:hypothetical protein
MHELLDAVASWPSLLLVLGVFGFAPGFCLRLIVLAYSRDDPRRKELIAELYAVTCIQRPPWVAQQLETALFEALIPRVSAWFRCRIGRALVRAVVRALDRGHDFVPIPARDLARELALAQDLAHELNLTRDLARELQLARAGHPRHAHQLDRELAPVRALELALARAHDSSHVLVMSGPGDGISGQGDTACISAVDLELDLDLALDLAADHDLDFAFVRVPALARTLAVVGILNRVRTLIHRAPLGRR